MLLSSSLSYIHCYYDATGSVLLLICAQASALFLMI